MKRIFILVLFAFSCIYGQTGYPLINTSHLDKLYEEVSVNGIKAGIMHPASMYPDYVPGTKANKIGASTDDAARAAIFYTRYYKATGDKEYIRKAKQLTQFLLSMQSDSGFYSFVNEDYSKNKESDGKNSLSRMCTWRSMWAISEVYNVLSEKSDSAYDKKFADRTRRSLIRTLPLVKSILKHYPGNKTNAGLILPEWLPSNSATDQAAVLILALKPLYEKAKDKTLNDYISKLAEGIMLMQMGDDKIAPYYAFLTSENSWNSNDCCQSEALLSAGEALNNQKMIQCALNEIEYFYDYIKNEGYFSGFKVDNLIVSDITYFPQTPSGISPLVRACMLAHKITGDRKYAEKGAEIALWLAGKNSVALSIYNPSSGIAFDGILSKTKIDRNSGAEAVAESLLALLETEKDPVASMIIEDYFYGKSGK